MIEPENKNQENKTANTKTTGGKVRDRERAEKNQSRANRRKFSNSEKSEKTRKKHLTDEVKGTKTKSTLSSKKKKTIGWVAGGILAGLAGLGIYKARAKAKEKGMKDDKNLFEVEPNTDYNDADLEKSKRKNNPEEIHN